MRKPEAAIKRSIYSYPGFNIFDCGTDTFRGVIVVVYKAIFVVAKE